MSGWNCPAYWAKRTRIKRERRHARGLKSRGRKPACLEREHASCYVCGAPCRESEIGHARCTGRRAA